MAQTNLTYGIEVMGDPMGGISAVVSSLPIGAELGQERLWNGVYYRLVYSPCTSTIGIGQICSPLVSSPASPYYVSPTTVSDAGQALGAVVVVHSTVTTNTYFWGAFRGYPVKLQGASMSLATGTKLFLSVTGYVRTSVSGTNATDIIGGANPIIGYVVGGVATTSLSTGAATVMTGVPSGDCAIYLPPLC